MLEQRAEIAHHAREVDRQPPPRATVMGTFADFHTSPLPPVPAPRYAPRSVASERQTAPPAQVFAMWGEPNARQRSPPQMTSEPPSSALDVRTSVEGMPLFFTQDGTAVQTSAHKISDPLYWTMDEPQMIFHGTGNPRDLTVMATYIQTADLPIPQEQEVTGPLLSYQFGPGDDMFTQLGDLRFNKYVTNRALQDGDPFKADNPPALVMALTQELNHGRLEPFSRDPNHVRQ
jgi:hypothetical protein